MLLAVLADGRAHGYALSAELRRRSDDRLVIPAGSLYPALHRLEAAGLVSSSWADGGTRRRREYALTREGRKALAAERIEWASFRRCVDAVLWGERA